MTSASPVRTDLSKIMLIVTVLSLARLAFSFAFGLVPQEAYYFFYSKHLALSYFDHPPVLAYLLRLFTLLFGEREAALRITAFTVTLLTQLAWLRLAQKFIGTTDEVSWAVILFSSTGMVTVLSLIATPDVPLMLFWTLTLLALHGAIFEERTPYWVLAGIGMGLSFDSKYTGIFLQLGLVLFLALSTRHRHLLLTYKPYLSLAVAHLVMAPVYAWNYQHHFASLLYQSVERKPAGVVHLRYFAALIGTQCVLLGPVLAAAIAWAALKFKQLPSPEQNKRAQILFLLCFFLPPLLLFTVWSIFSLVKPNWLYPCYLTGILLALGVMSKPWTRANLVATGLLHLLAAVQLLFYPIAIKSDDTWYGWKELAARVDELSRAHPQAFIFSADGYKTTAELLFYLGRKVYGPNVIGQPALQFDFVDSDLSSLEQRDALFVNSTPTDLSSDRSGEIPAGLVPYFGRIQELDPILIFKDSRVVRRFRVYFCEQYRNLGRPAKPRPQPSTGLN